MSRDVVAAMTAYTLELREAEIKLNQNESAEDLPRAWKESALAAIVDRPWNRYPDFESMTLRRALATAYGYEPENVLVGNGSNELLAATIGAFVGPGTPVVLPKPSFALYEKLVTIAGGIAIPIGIDPSTGLLPLDEMLRAIERCDNAVAIVCSPNNPTGGVLPQNGIDALLATGATVLFDRAYGDFHEACHSERSEESPASRSEGDSSPSEPALRSASDEGRLGMTLPPLHDRLVTFSTFSKAWGLAALRVGWLASTASTCREIRKVKLPYSLNIISEAVAAAALDDRPRRDERVARIIAERERVFAAMKTIDGVTPCPSRANFIFFTVGQRRPGFSPAGRTEVRPTFDALCARGILIREYANALRVSIGTREENDRFLEALRGTMNAER